MVKDVVAYFIAGPDDYTKIDYSIVTKVAYAYVFVKPDGSLQRPAYDPKPLISHVHAQGRKIILSFQIVGRPETDQFLANSTARSNAITNLLNEVKALGLDGINNDIEEASFPNNSVTGQPQKPLMTAFQTLLYDRFKASNAAYDVSFAVRAYYPESDLIYDMALLKNKCDAMYLMTYEWTGLWSTIAGPDAPQRLDNDMGNIDSIEHYAKLISKDKLYFGIPWFGHEFTTVDNTRLASRVAGTPVKDLFYSDWIKQALQNVKYDTTWETPWYSYPDTSGHYIQGHYENLQSLGAKLDYVNRAKLGGVLIWAANYGLNNRELWTQLKQKITIGMINNTTITIGMLVIILFLVFFLTYGSDI